MKKENFLFYFVVLFTILIITNFIYWLFCIGDIHYLIKNPSLADKGTLGDLLSGHFSALAFIWFVYGVFLQRKEFELIRQEHHDHNEEFKAQSDIYIKQNILMLSQWLNDWIINLEHHIKKEVSEEKTDIFFVITNKKIDVKSFKNQCEIIQKDYALIANKETFSLIENFFQELQKIKNIINIELVDENYKNIFQNKIKSSFGDYLRKFEYCYFIAHMSHIVINFSSPTKQYDYIQTELSEQIREDLFKDIDNFNDAKATYKRHITSLYNNTLDIKKYNIKNIISI